MRKIIDLIPVFDCFLIMLFIFMGAAVQSRMHDEGKWTARADEYEKKIGLREQTISSLRDELRNLRALTATVERLREENEKLQQAREAVIANQQTLIDGLSAIFANQELLKRVRVEAQTGLSQADAKRVLEGLQAAADPKKIVEFILKNQEVMSRYAAINVYLDKDDSVFMNDLHIPATKDEYVLRNEIARFMRDYRRDRQGTQRFLFVVKYGDCTYGCMRRWNEAMSNLRKEKGEDLIDTRAFYQKERD
ncbi:MAG: hypothetical protein HZA50_19625 [Planctomycetes bacterium]|nr:hypothetical protein [Planctomycetota bacterium]